jgi:hypothetical protein
MALARERGLASGRWWQRWPLVLVVFFGLLELGLFTDIDP